MEYSIPDISKFESTREEQEVATRFTRYVSASERERTDAAPSVWFVADNQFFQLHHSPEDDRHAEWFCWMLAKALIKVQQRDKTGGL